MDSFSFYLSYYGLILGLSVAQVASGLLNAIGARHRVHVGWLTPALAIFVLLDITSFWMFAWGMRDSIRVTWGSMYLGLLIALVYFIASGLIFPRNIDEWPDLDDYYWKHKRIVVGGIIIPDLIVIAQASVYHPAKIDLMLLLNLGSYWLPLILLLFARRKWQDLTLLSILVMGNVVIPFIPNWHPSFAAPLV